MAVRWAVVVVLRYQWFTFVFILTVVWLVFDSHALNLCKKNEVRSYMSVLIIVTLQIWSV